MSNLPTSSAMYRELYRNDFGTFAQRAFYALYPDAILEWNWHQDLIIDRLNAMEAGDLRRHLVLVAPRSLKSFICSVAWPAFLLGRHPSMKIVAASYAQPLSEELARLCMELIDNDWYKSVFDTKLARTKRAVERFHTTKGGYRIATSVGGALTGRGGDLVIIDDPIKAEDALSEAAREAVSNWFTNTMRTRLDNRGKGQILVVMQRLHEADLAGALLEQGWPHVTLRTIAIEPEEHHFMTVAGPRIVRRQPGDLLHPSRDTHEVVAEMKEDMGSYSFQAQFQQDPMPVEGNLVKRAWFVRYPASSPPPFVQVIQSWDTAQKIHDLADFSVCTTWGITADRRCYLIHVLRKRLTHPELKAAVREQAMLHDASTVLVEDKVSGTGLAQDLTHEGFYRVKLILPKGDKQMRLVGVSAMIENGFVLVPESAPWLDDYLDEITAFPGARHDDQVDSTSQALTWIREVRAEPSITTYYRRLNEARDREAAQTFRFRSPDGYFRQIHTRDGRRLNTENDGCVTVTAADVGTLRLLQWIEMPFLEGDD